MIKDFMNGRPVVWNDKELQLKWVRPELPPIPMHVAGYGPKALALTGRIADGAIMQIADPDLIRWSARLLQQGVREAGRAPGSVKIMAAAPAHMGKRSDVRERVRWFPALVSNHVVDLVRRYGERELPATLTAYVRNRPGYDYRHHAESGSANAAFVDDESVDRFCVIGEESEHLEKLQELAEAGVEQFNIYLMSGDEERVLDFYGARIIPKMRSATQPV
jgi:alkanesulfonate monooxygenase SsuD/methylene tetrahydromethanopterin reductase-like flavin-dependent oxidoreductase (luciferase family)